MLKLVREVAFAAALLGILGGCGEEDDGIGRKAVSGTVTLDGKPLTSGSVLLVPKGTGPAVGGEIVEGAFSLSEAEGPVPGPYRVEILSIQPTGQMVPDPEGGKDGTMEERKNVIPDRYGKRSQLKAEVTKEGPNAFVYELDSKPDKPSAKRRR